jgi:hypothetical protein
VTEAELRQLCLRERVTLQTSKRKGGATWVARRRVDGKLHGVYLCAQSKLPTFTEADFLEKVQTLPDKEADMLTIQRLPGNALSLHKAGRTFVLLAEDVHTLSSYVAQDADSNALPEGTYTG